LIRPRRHCKATGFNSNFMRAIWAAVAFTPKRAEGRYMWIQNIVHNACPICGKETTLAVIEPHPTHPTITLYTYRCMDSGAVKTTSVLRSTAPTADHPKVVAVIPPESVQMPPAAESGRR
jgi:hypothetical protein